MVRKNVDVVAFAAVSAVPSFFAPIGSNTFGEMRVAPHAPKPCCRFFFPHPIVPPPSAYAPAAVVQSAGISFYFVNNILCWTCIVVASKFAFQRICRSNEMKSNRNWSGICASSMLTSIYVATVLYRRSKMARSGCLSSYRK